MRRAHLYTQRRVFAEVVLLCWGRDAGEPEEEGVEVEVGDYGADRAVRVQEREHFGPDLVRGEG